MLSIVPAVFFIIASFLIFVNVDRIQLNVSEADLIKVSITIFATMISISITIVILPLSL